MDTQNPNSGIKIKKQYKYAQELIFNLNKRLYELTSSANGFQ